MQCRQEDAQWVDVPSLSEVVDYLLSLSPEEAVYLAEDLLDAGYFDQPDATSDCHDK